MFSFLYVTCAAVFLFDVGTSVPFPQVAPITSCPSTHFLQNGACYLRSGTPVAQPSPPVSPPCSSAVPSCQAAYPPPTAPYPAPNQPPCNQQSATIVCTTTPPPPPPTTPSTAPTTTATTATTTAPAPKPDPIIRCPTGTMLINGYCHLIYCGTGVYHDGKCIVTVCPDGAVWTGSKCETPPPSPYETTLNMSNLVITNVKQSNVNHVVNYTSNNDLYISESPEQETVTNKPCPQQSTTPAPLPTAAQPPTNCCTVITPRVCKWDGTRHICRSQKYRRCGSICTNENIYLNPPTVVVPPPPPPPPPPTPCMDGGCDYDQEPVYPDCLMCNNMSHEFCRTYCQRNICQERRCQSIELRSYCGSYPGAIGCRSTDGCTQDWCDGY